MLKEKKKKYRTKEKPHMESRSAGWSVADHKSNFNSRAGRSTIRFCASCSLMKAKCAYIMPVEGRLWTISDIIDIKNCHWFSLEQKLAQVHHHHLALQSVVVVGWGRGHMHVESCEGPETAATGTAAADPQFMSRRQYPSPQPLIDCSF